MEVVIHTILLIHALFFFIKILFELSLGINRVTNFFELVNLGAMLLFILTKYVEVIWKSGIVF